MKKILVLFAIATATILTYCGNGSAKETVDSTAVSVDSLNVDSTAVEAPVAPTVEGENVEVSKELEEVK